MEKPIHFLSVDDFPNDVYARLFDDARFIKENWEVAAREIAASCANRSVSLLFTEPSTRTSMSFDKAAQAVGCRTAALNMNTSSIAKGESYQDTACMAALRSHVLVARHGGAADTLRNLADDIFPLHQELSRVAIINAGEGAGEHPTQALLDLFTIKEHFGRTDVHIGLYGDLKYGRTVHSLMKLAPRFGARFTCIAPRQDLQMPDAYLDIAAKYGNRPACVTAIEDVLGDLDVLYVTRLQRERTPRTWFSNLAAASRSLTGWIDIPGMKADETRPLAPHKLHHKYDEKISGYGVTRELLGRLPPTAILMHPLPRLDELPDFCDMDSRARYMTQADNGIVTRMALLRHCLGVG